MFNELLFLLQASVISTSALIALILGSQALTAFICICCILANFFVLKQITLFGFNATCSDAFTIGATFGLNLLQEYFGRSNARMTVFINFFLLIFYAIVSQIQLTYIPSIFDNTQPHFNALLTFMPRIVIASFIVYFIAQMTDYWIYGLLKQIWHSRFLIMRNYTSMAISQFVDTILFSFLGLYGIVQNIGEIIVISYTIKLAAIILTGPFIRLSRALIAYIHP